MVILTDKLQGADLDFDGGGGRMKEQWSRNKKQSDGGGGGGGKSLCLCNAQLQDHSEGECVGGVCVPPFPHEAWEPSPLLDIGGIFVWLRSLIANYIAFTSLSMSILRGQLPPTCSYSTEGVV